MKTYEVFLKKAGKDPFEHAGSMLAPDDQLDVLLARESYDRRGEGAEMWLVERGHVLTADPVSLAVNADRPHRRNDGSVLAARRAERRAAGTQ